MKNLLHFIVSFHFTILFIIVELCCFLLLVNYNAYQKSHFFRSSNAVTGEVYRRISAVSDYFSLVQTNEHLNRENANLRNLLEASFKTSIDSPVAFIDSLYQQKYTYFPAKIINNSVHKQLNYISLNKGKKHGIEPEMAVITDEGVVGIVKTVSDHYSFVISLLNKRFKISAKLKDSNYFGSLSWDGRNYKKAILSEIPLHVNITKGDTIVTSGFSSIFPEGIPIGIVDETLTSSGSSFQNLRVFLANDFKQLSYVKIVGNLTKDERISLEKEAENE